MFSLCSCGEMLLHFYLMIDVILWALGISVVVLRYLKFTSFCSYKQYTHYLQVMEARAMWMQELHKQTKPDSDWFGSARVKDGNNVLHEDFECARTFDFAQTTITTTDYETVKHPIVSTGMHFVDKSAIEEKTVIKTEDKDVQLVGSSLRTVVPNYEEDEDDWLNEEDSDLGGYKTIIPVGNEEDISFSDLEDDASNSIPVKSKRVSEGTDTKTT